MLKTIGHTLLAGTALLTLSTALMAQDVVNTPAQVLTPFGYRDAANVHLVPPGFDLMAMPDGHIRMANAATGARSIFLNGKKRQSLQSPITAGSPTRVGSIKQDHR